MAGISSKAAGKLENRYKYNGIEFDEDLGVDTYEAKFRMLNQQIGRWWQIDPKVEGYEDISPYASNYNNPIRYTDPLGDEGGDGIWGRIVGTVKQIASDARDFAAGVGAAIADNNTFGLNSQRAAVGNAAANKGLANFGMDVGDAISIVQGTAQAIIGGAAATTLAGLAPVTGGLSLVPAAGAAAIGLDGVAVGVMGVKNLVNQTDRVNTQGSGEGRGSNNRKPDPNATGDHSVSNDRGSTTFKKNDKNPSGFQETKRVDTKGKSHKGVETPHVHENGKVRPANQNDIPKTNLDKNKPAN